MHYDSQGTNDTVRFFTEYLSRNAFLCNECISYAKRNLAPNSFYTQENFYNSFRFFSVIYPLVLKGAFSPYTVNLFLNLNQLTKSYGKDKRKILAGLLRNGLLVELCKLEDKVILSWLNYMEFLKILNPIKRDLVLKLILLIKALTPTEQHKLGCMLAQYLFKISITAENTIERKITFLTIFAKSIGLVNSNNELFLYKQLVEGFVSYKKLDLDERVINFIVKLVPVISKFFWDEEIIIKFVKNVEDYKSLNEDIREFMVNYNEFIESVPHGLKDQKIDLSEDELKLKFYHNLASFLKETYSSFTSLHKVLENEMLEAKFFIEFLLKRFPESEIVKQVSFYKISTDDLYEIMFELTSSKGHKSINRYLNEPSKLNLFRIIVENHLILKVLKLKFH